MRILFLDLDTLRPDHLGCYGYPRDTSPVIDSIAKEGVRFSNYYCSDAPCLPSRAALFSGRFGIHNGAVDHGGLCADMRPDGLERGFNDTLARESLPAFLRRKGFKTATISPFAERHASWTFYAGFSEMFNTGGIGLESAEEVTPTALDWIERHADQDNWFLHINYWDAHTPFRAPESFGNPFENDAAAAWITEETLERHRKMAGPHGAREVSMFDNTESADFPRQPGEIKTLGDVKRLVDGYDCGIRYMDGHLGKLIDALKEQGVYEDMAIIISADHGENMGELGIYAEHATADHTTCNIPMIIKWPGGMKNHEDTGLHYSLDLLPTLAEIFGSKEYVGELVYKPPNNILKGIFTEQENKSWDGQSFAGSLLRGGNTGRDYLVLSQCSHVVQRSVRFKDYIYIKTYHDGFHLFPSEMLYNIKTDIHEQENLAETRKDLCLEAVYYYMKWLDEMMLTSKSDTDPLWTVIRQGGPHHAKGQLKAYCERLKSTGREEEARLLKERHPYEFGG